MANLSKSKILNYRQCHKKLWLSVHKPKLVEYSEATLARFKTGDLVGTIAQSLFVLDNSGVLIEPFKDGFSHAIKQTSQLIKSRTPLFEASFSAGGGFAMADVMLPINNNAWKMIEVKSSASVKEYHYDDIAVQAYVARAAGVELEQVSLACIDSKWTYLGNNDYQGLLKDNDLTDVTLSRVDEVAEWFVEAQSVVQEKNEPAIAIGEHCFKPFDCAFYEYCSKDEPVAEFPIKWLPRIQTKALKDFIAENNVTDMREVPDDLLNATQQKVKQHTVANTVFFDQPAAQRALADYSLPAYFLDFETTSLAIPIWAGTRPFQQVVFQFSCHQLTEDGELLHSEFLDVSGNDPSEQCIKQMLKDCGSSGPIFAYYASFEKSRIKDLAKRFPEYRDTLLALNERIVDLLPIARNFYYHPSQQGSWSIKKVLPAIVPDLDYSQLDGIQDGGMAMEAFIEAIHPDTSMERKQAIHEELLKYCELDTYAMVRLWQFLMGSELILT